MLVLSGALILAGTSNVNKQSTPVLLINEKTIHVELADTEEKRIRGLGGRETIGGDRGMLFVFPKSDTYGIWMKGMRFPLDVVWLSPTRTDADMTQTNAERKQTLVVVDMKENVAVETYPNVFYPGSPALYVLELKGGSAKKNGIHVGSAVNLKE